MEKHISWLRTETTFTESICNGDEQYLAELTGKVYVVAWDSYEQIEDPLGILRSP
jgi:hypothetical protein